MSPTEKRRQQTRVERLEGLVPALDRRHVLIVGCGSVGSHIADILCRHGVGNFTLVDPDTVDTPNLSRSVYDAADIGAPKVTALERHLSAIDPETHIDTLDCAASCLTEADLTHELGRANILIAATDDPIAQAALNHHAYATGTPAVFCALYRRADAGEIVITVPGATPCWTCATGGSAADANTVDKDYGTGRLAAETALGADILTVVSVAAKHAIGLLAGPDSPAGTTTMTALARHSMCIIANNPGWDWFPDTFRDVTGQYAPQSVWLTVKGDHNCPVCGTNPEPPLPALDPAQVALLAGNDDCEQP